jgi:hypothetical protein
MLGLNASANMNNALVASTLLDPLAGAGAAGEKAAANVIESGLSDSSAGSLGKSAGSTTTKHYDGPRSGSGAPIFGRYFDARWAACWDCQSWCDAKH